MLSDAVPHLLAAAKAASSHNELEQVLTHARAVDLHPSYIAVIAASSPACAPEHLTDATVDVVVLWADGRDDHVGLEHLFDPDLARVLRALAPTHRMLSLGQVLASAPAPMDPTWADLVIALAAKGFSFDAITEAIADPHVRTGIATLVTAGAPAAPDELAVLTRSLLPARRI